MNYQQLLKSGLQHILHSNVMSLNKIKNKQENFLKFNKQLNQKIESIDSREEFQKAESLIDNL